MAQMFNEVVSIVDLLEQRKKDDAFSREIEERFPFDNIVVAETIKNALTQLNFTKILTVMNLFGWKHVAGDDEDSLYEFAAELAARTYLEMKYTNMESIEISSGGFHIEFERIEEEYYDLNCSIEFVLESGEAMYTSFS